MKRASSRITARLGFLVDSWFGWVLFAVVAYGGAMVLTAAVVLLFSRLGVFTTIDATSYALITRLLMYALLIALMLLIPAWVKHRISRREMALDRPMEWRDIGLGAAGVVIYLLLAMGALALLKLIPGVDVNQAQDLDVGQVYGAARMLVFVVLVLVTPFAEELLFRGILYGRLRSRHLPAWGAAVVVSLLFGLAHGQLNVGIDVFCLSLVACYARELTGSIWAGVVLHMIKNFIAFAVVFLINQG